jgi:lipase chaperone LimK
LGFIPVICAAGGRRGVCFMKRNKIIAVIGVALAVIITVIIAVIMTRGKKQEGYVFDRNSKIGMKDVQIYLGQNEFKADDVRDYFKKDVINSYTLKYFLFLDDKFKDSRNPEELLQSVREYLATIMPQDEADKLFAVYKIYVYYQRDIHDKMTTWGRPSTPEEAIDYLHKLQDYRRKVFGDENADTLFGPIVKLQEYPIRRGMIIGNQDLYGAEKEKRLNDLKKDMWGEEADTVDNDTEPLDRYQEKLKIYQKDMAEMTSDEERQAKTRQFREEIFTPEQMKRLDDVDRAAAEEKKNERDYYAQENDIKNDNNLDADEKAQKIRELQDQMFESEAEAFRRRQIVKDAIEQPKE